MSSSSFRLRLRLRLPLTPSLTLLTLTLTLLTLSLLCTTPSLAQSTSDPTCASGIAKIGACCPSVCGKCGGDGCYQRSLQYKTRCCASGILNPAFKVPSCASALPPCIIPVTDRDPQCLTGLPSGKACCSKACGTCGGPGCGARSRKAGTLCCMGVVTNPKTGLKPCSQSLPPCILSPSSPKPPSPSPSPSPATKKTTEFSSIKGKWRTAQVDSNSPTVVARHEACAVMVDGLVVLVGGRGAKPVSVYDPKKRTWTTKSRFNPWRQIHHFQCVAYKGSVWIVSSWTKNFPREENNDVVFEYVVRSDVWKTYPGLPEPRRRGGAATVRIGTKVYVIAGNRGGHGDHAESLGWVDTFDLVSKKWTIGALADMPGPKRDHVGAAVLKSGDICVAGGRRGDQKGFFNKNVKETYCYSFGEKKWIRKQDLPAPRAGAMTGTSCDGKLVIAGGEGDGKAYKRVDVFDGETWTRAPDMVEARHGSGLAVANCKTCGHVFVPSGSGRLGGRPELTTTEEWVPQGAPDRCEKY